MAECKDCNFKNRWSLLLKPTHDCNFNCEYCYDEPHRKRYKGKYMSIDLLYEILSKVSKHTDNLQLIYHGGEPLMAGIEWYENAQKVINLFSHMRIDQSMQTNGSLLNSEWGKFCKKYGILVGISFDGPFQYIRNRSIPVEEHVRRIREFQAEGNSPGFITVINNENFRYQIEIYEYMRDVFGSHVAFNRIFRSYEADKNGLLLDVKECAKETARFYDYWIHDTKGRDERTCREFTQLFLGLGGHTCSYSDCRHNWLCINPIGDIYPCDRYVPDKYLCGNIRDFDSIVEIYASEPYRLYYSEIENKLNNYCRKCDYGVYCCGQCPSNAIVEHGSGDKVVPDMCTSFKYTFLELYKVFRNIDIYNEGLYKEIRQLFIQNPVFTPREIKEELLAMGITKEFKFEDDVNKLLSCPEFKLLRIINPIQRSSLVDHLDFSLPTMPVSVNDEDEDALLQIRDIRRQTLRQVIMDNLKEILAL